MAKFNLGDKVRLKSDVAKRYDIPLYMILTITNIFDCGCVVYRCDETDYLMWTEDDFEDIKYITSSNGQIIGITKEQFSKMGDKERLELKQKDPNKYNELKGEQ